MSAKRKLLVLDVEGTLFQTKIRLPGTTIDSTIWQTIAHVLGPEAVREEIETHRKWHRRVYPSYLDWMRETVEIHKKYNLTEQVFRKVINEAEYCAGVQEVLAGLDRNRFEIVLISGGFRELAARVQKDLYVHHAFAACEYLFSEGKLASFNLLPCDFEGKLDFIKLMLREYSLGEQDWIFCGDGVNDVPIALAAPFSVAVNAHFELKKVATASVRTFAQISQLLESIVA